MPFLKGIIASAIGYVMLSFRVPISRQNASEQVNLLRSISSHILPGLPPHHAGSPGEARPKGYHHDKIALFEHALIKDIIQKERN